MNMFKINKPTSEGSDLRRVSPTTGTTARGSTARPRVTEHSSGAGRMQEPAPGTHRPNARGPLQGRRPPPSRRAHAWERAEGHACRRLPSRGRSAACPPPGSRPGARCVPAPLPQSLPARVPGARLERNRDASRFLRPPRCGFCSSPGGTGGRWAAQGALRAGFSH